VGGYLDGPVTQHGLGNREIVAGRNKDYGNKTIGLFQTSDSRTRDFANLGIHSTWVKWATPTAEAIRQACLARESRLSHTEPQQPTSCVTMINVSNSQFLGPIALALNPQYNAIIGGRGTGKSTILEYLRWALCDQPPAENGDLADLHSKRKELIQKTLFSLGAVVEVSFVVNETPHIVRRKAATTEILLKIGAEEFKACTESDVRTLLPIQAYSQKQLSGIGVRLDELARFVHAPIETELATITTKRDEVASSLRSAYEAVRRHRATLADIAKDDLQRTSLATQLEQLRKNLRGLSAKDQRIIGAQTLHDDERVTVDNWTREVNDTKAALTELAESFRDLPATLTSPETPNRQLLQRAHADLSGTVTWLRSSIETLQASLEPESPSYRLRQYDQALAEWRQKATQNEQDYAAAKLRSVAHATTLTQVNDVENRLRALDAKIAEQRRAAQKLGEPATRLAELRSEWLALQKEEADLIGKQCDQLTTLSGGLIRATLRRGWRVEKVEDLLRGALKGTKIRSDRYDAIWEHIRKSADGHAEWAELLDELEALAATEVTADQEPILPPTPILESNGFSTRDRAAIARHLAPEAWLTLMTQGLGNLPEFEYQTREMEYIKFSDASAGQQATALLYALLNQPGPPLIIDQPEDDLDNKVMDEIVREIWKAKTRRQLIFSSHNANLVVNGDAELVVCCDYRVAGDQSGGKIKLEGAIDMPDVNAEITVVMEGGREAFALRQAKYGF
jgi:type III restriction enzyme